MVVLILRVVRLKDGIVPENLEVNSKITWPDNGETVDLLGREEPKVENEFKINAKIDEIIIKFIKGSYLPSNQTDKYLKKFLNVCIKTNF